MKATAKAYAQWPLPKDGALLFSITVAVQVESEIGDLPLLPKDWPPILEHWHDYLLWLP